MYALILLVLLGVTQADTKPALSQDETRMVEAINKYRAGYKLPPLKPDATLVGVARYRVPHYTHQYQGRWMWDEVKRSGFQGFATDDLCQGARSPEEAVDGWAHSSVGHANQMRGQFKMNGKWEDRRFDKVGVAHQGSNWIAIFGRLDADPK